MRRTFAKWIVRAAAGELEPWTGAVERRAPATYQERSIHYTWMCENPHCRQWTMNGAWRYGICNFCATPRELT